MLESHGSIVIVPETLTSQEVSPRRVSPFQKFLKAFELSFFAFAVSISLITFGCPLGYTQPQNKTIEIKYIKKTVLSIGAAGIVFYDDCGKHFLKKFGELMAWVGAGLCALYVIKKITLGDPEAIKTLKELLEFYKGLK